jgi:poly-gamma-glutamate synthesis protein (capsule biosynthesis protein)
VSFRGEIHPIAEQVAVRMRGVSWHPELPGGFVSPALDELRLLVLSFWTFDDQSAQGQLIVRASVADEVVSIFRNIYEARFPIERMQLVCDYAADDERSMAANNTSAFNCRLVAGTGRPSAHASGLAIDINPVQNPYVVNGSVHPKAATAYLDRTKLRPGMLTEDGPVVRAFVRAGWDWGGLWDEPKDYHHFQKATDSPDHDE